MSLPKEREQDIIHRTPGVPSCLIYPIFSHLPKAASLTLHPLLPGALTQRDGRPALRTTVILAVQPCLRADVQLIFSLVADFGAHTGLGDEVQALAVTSVITPWGGGTNIVPFRSGGHPGLQLYPNSHVNLGASRDPTVGPSTSKTLSVPIPSLALGSLADLPPQLPNPQRHQLTPSKGNSCSSLTNPPPTRGFPTSDFSDSIFPPAETKICKVISTPIYACFQPFS